MREKEKTKQKRGKKSKECAMMMMCCATVAAVETPRPEKGQLHRLEPFGNRCASGVTRAPVDIK